MKTSMNLACGIVRFGEKKAIELYKKAGFTGFDFSFGAFLDYDREKKKYAPIADHPLFGKNSVSYARELRRIADDCGIPCLTAHAPHPSDGAGMDEYLKRSLELTEILGGEIVVIHPCCRADLDTNLDFYRELLPIAKAHGVRIACENMWDWNHSPEVDHAFPCACSTHENFLAHLEGVGDDALVACLDIGHAEMRGLGTSSVLMANTLGKRIRMLHIHDNDMWHDDHAAPFTGRIDYAPIMRALKAVGYAGDITLEIVTDYLFAPSEEESFRKLVGLADAAARLRDIFEKA